MLTFESLLEQLQTEGLTLAQAGRSQNLAIRHALTGKVDQDRMPDARRLPIIF